MGKAGGDADLAPIAVTLLAGSGIEWAKAIAGRQPTA